MEKIRKIRWFVLLGLVLLVAFWTISARQYVAQEENHIVKVDDYKSLSGLRETDKKGLVIKVPEFITTSKGDEEAELYIEVDHSGQYKMIVEYVPNITISEQILVDVIVNNQEAERTRNIVLPGVFVYDTWEFGRMSNGNHIFPNQISLQEETTHTLKVGGGLYENSPLLLELSEGENTVVIRKKSGQVQIHNISFVQYSQVPSYEEYIAELHIEKENYDAVSENFVLEAEHFTYKNDGIFGVSSKKHYLASPYETGNALLNVIDRNYNQSGQKIAYAIEIKEDGFYYIGLRGATVGKDNSPVFLDIEIDGDVPFEEFDQVRLPYNRQLTDYMNQHPVFLTKGIHEIAFVQNSNAYSFIANDMKQLTDEINEMAISIKRLTGNVHDRNREWNMEEYLPNMVTDMESWNEQLIGFEQRLSQVINGNDTDVLSSEELENIRMAKMQLAKLLEEPNAVPNNINILSEGGNSVLQMLSSSYYKLYLQELLIDQIIITTDVNQHIYKESNFAYGLFEGIRTFVDSFREEENIVADENTLDVWIRGSRQYRDTLQLLADERFTEKTGIKIKLSLINDQGKLTLANAAGKQPDVALSVDSYYVNDLAVRGSLADLRQFDGIYDVLEDVAPGSLLQMIIDDKLYGLPQTQDFYMLFYRKDILEELQLDVPKTWDEVMLMLPVLQRYGMNFYTPLSSENSFKSWPMTMPFYTQFNAKIYAEDGSKTIIDAEEGVNAMRYMTELFTVYGLPIQVKSFYNDFRFGLAPIGVGNFTNYIELRNGAPELANRWGIALVPTLKDGEKSAHWTTGASQAICMFEASNKKEKSWEFIQWWLSEDIQVEYTNRLQTVYGREYLWNSGNLKALAKMPLPVEDLAIMNEQVKWIKEAPKIPGGYFTEREVSNAWNRIVFDGVDVRTAIGDSTIISNREITRKLEEFGYMEDGIMVREYIIPTIEKVEGWVTDEK